MSARVILRSGKGRLYGVERRKPLLSGVRSIKRAFHHRVRSVRVPRLSWRASLNARWTLILGLWAFVAFTGCPGPVTQSDTGAVDTSTTDDTSVPPIDTQGPEDNCCPLGICSVGKVCLDGACHPGAGAAGCYRNVDCLAGQVCEGATTCGCDAKDCVASVGSCTYPEGCCNSDSECDGDAVCATGQCWAPSDAEEAVSKRWGLHWAVQVRRCTELYLWC